MKRLSLAAAMVSLSLLCAVNYAQDSKPPASKPAASKPTTQKSIWQNVYYRQMAEVCGLSEDQKSKIEPLVVEHQKAAAELEPKRQAAAETLKAAKTSKNADAIAKATKDQAVIKQQIGDLDKKHEADMKAVMTPEQQAKWQQYQKLLLVKRHFTGIKLTDEQDARIKGFIDEAFKGVPEDDNEARAAALKKVNARVESEVLTADQKAQLAAEATSKPASKPAKAAENK